LARPRILLADDHADFVALVVQLIESEFEVLHTFEDGQAIVDSARNFDADLLLMDISMPGISGIEAARQLRNLDAAAKVVFLTVHADPDYLRSALAAGALGYVVKDRLATDLIPALRAAMASRRFISPPLAGDLESGDSQGACS
jgi:DNA-binding NarL/FixJ family response regulator